MQEFIPIREKLKSLFLDELLADEGWNAYLDLLLSNISVENLLLLRNEGFPFNFNIRDYILTPDNKPVTETFDVSVSGGNVVFSYPKTNYDPKLNRLLDFSTVRVYPKDFTKVEVMNGRSWMTVWDSSTDYPYIEWVPTKRFRFTAPLSKDFNLLPYSLPEQLDPDSIDEWRYVHHDYYNPLEPATSPQALYGLIAKLLRGIRFRITYQFTAGVGSNRVSDENYVKFLNLTEYSPGSGVVDYMTTWTDSKVPIDALRDRFGFGDSLSRIIGYDKQYLVVESNAPATKITYLMADFGNPSGSRISVTPEKVTLNNKGQAQSVRVTTTPAGPFNPYKSAIGFEYTRALLLANDFETKEPILLADPASILPVPQYGITKFYDMMTILKGGQLVSAIIEINGSNITISKELEDILKEILGGSFKPGVTVDVEHTFITVYSGIRMGDKTVQQEYIGIQYRGNNLPPNGVVRLTNRDAKDSVVVVVRPYGIGFNVKGQNK